MKSRRELLAGLIVDLSKTTFITLILGKFATPDIFRWLPFTIGIILVLFLLWFAWNIHPETDLDREWIK